jgi:WD40 repeat protein
MQSHHWSCLNVLIILTIASNTTAIVLIQYYDLLSYTNNLLEHVSSITPAIVKQCMISVLATGGKDKRLGFVDTNGSIVHIQKKAHDDSISKVFFMNNQNLVSGDDSGVVKIWDLRFSTCVF